MAEIVVYSAIFAARDLVEIPKISGIDFRLITDEERYANTEGVIVTPLPIAKDPRRSARLFKIMPQILFPGYRRWIWMDGNIRLQEWTTAMLLAGIKGPLAAFTHRDRDCAYKEAEICSSFKLDDPMVIDAQMEGYRKEGFPVEFGLGETGVLVRDNTRTIQRFNRRWWSEVSTKSLRDQLSFNYCAWKESIPVHYMGRCTGTLWFRMNPHSN